MFKSRSTILFALATCAALSLFVNCGNDGGAGDGDSAGDGDGDGDSSVAGNNGDGDTGDGDMGDPIECLGLDAECQANNECCGAVKCLDGGDGVKRCSDESICQGVGSDCSSAAECCSLSCVGGACAGDGSICEPAGTECADNSECCSNDCQGTCQSLGPGCVSFGETCDAEGFDSDCCSKSCENFGTDEEPDLRCARSSACNSRGDICSEDTDCCSGVCLDGRCPTQDEINGQLFAGEPCSADKDCASYACASNIPGGPKTCQFLGGCRPAGEICSESWQCCSNLDISEGGGDMCLEENASEGVGCEAHAIEGLSVCGLNTDPKEVGEICFDTEGNKVHDCCPSDNCEETVTGVWRCSGGEGFDECREDGDTCQAADQCCSGICAPVVTETGTELRCGASCIEADGLCTTNADCCGGICSDGICDEETSECTPLGAACTDSGECCSGSCIDGYCQSIVVR